MEFDEAGEVVKSYGNPILLDSNIEQGIIKIIIKYILTLIQLVKVKVSLTLQR